MAGGLPGGLAGAGGWGTGLGGVGWGGKRGGAGGRPAPSGQAGGAPANRSHRGGGESADVPRRGAAGPTGGLGAATGTERSDPPAAAGQPADERRAAAIIQPVDVPNSSCPRFPDFASLYPGYVLFHGWMPRIRANHGGRRPARALKLS